MNKIGYLKLNLLVLLILTGLIFLPSTVSANSPSIKGHVYYEGTTIGIPGVYVKWTDGCSSMEGSEGSCNRVMYTQTNSAGEFYFQSYQTLSQDTKTREHNTWIKPTDPSQAPILSPSEQQRNQLQNDGWVRKLSTDGGTGFGCYENNHTFTVIHPTATMPVGYFVSSTGCLNSDYVNRCTSINTSTVELNLNNGSGVIDIGNFYYRLPVEKPKNLTATCPAPGTTANLSWQSPDSTYGYSYQLRVDKDPPSWGGRTTINSGDVLNDNAPSPYSFSSEPGRNYKWWVHACKSWGCSDQETSNFSCGSCPQAPSSQTPPNGDQIACTATAVDLSWTAPAGSVYNIRVDGEGAKVANNIPNNCTPHTICINGYTQEKIKINIQSGKSYTWWVDLQSPASCGYISTGQKTFTTASCNPPTLGTLNISADSSDNPKGVAEGTYGISGSRSDDSVTRGSNYYNSLKITQKVTPGTNASDIALVGMAFTDEAKPPQNSLSSLTSSAGSSNGFIVLYANKQTTVDGKTFEKGKYYLYSPLIGGWTDGITQSTTNFFNYTKQGIFVQPLRPEPYADKPRENPTFRVRMYSQMGSRTWGTYGYLLHTTNGVQTQSIISKDPTQH